MTDEKDSFKRARSDEQKGERREEILEAAQALLLESETERELSLNDLARRVGMAKSNLYRYFESREAILLELLRREWTGWLVDFEETLRCHERVPLVNDAARHAFLDKLAAMLAKSFAARPFLGRLSAILPTVLEHNVEAQTVFDFKRDAVEFFCRVAALLYETAPLLPPRRYEELLHLSLTALVGAWSFGHPSPEVRAVLHRPELASMRRDFERDFTRHVSLLARALLAESDC